MELYLFVSVDTHNFLSYNIDNMNFTNAKKKPNLISDAIHSYG